MNTRRWTALCSVLLLGAVTLTGCSKKEDQSSNKTEEKTEQKAAATPIDPSTTGSVSGTVKYTGTAPKPVKIDMSQDAACKGQNQSETIVADNGNLANAFVYVKDGLGDRTFDAPKEPVVIDQDGCRYHPHVLGVMVGQPVQIKNSDNTTHNIHPTPKNNREWNESQPPKTDPLVKTFTREEIMMPVKCNQHPWMKMYINVMKSPFFAVTDKSGKYEIKGLPPGTYTIAVVTEKAGEQDQKVTIAPNDAKTADFTLSGGSSAAGAGATN